MELVLGPLLDKLILLLVIVGVGAALVLGWLHPASYAPVGNTNHRASTLSPLPGLEVSDLLLLIGVKEAQIAVLQRQVEKLQAQVSERTESDA
jgi:hypothetical protein